MKSRGNYFYFKKLELKTNFTQIPNQLFDINLTATEKLILVYLISNAESFRVTHYRIEKSVGSDHRTVKKAIRKFQDMKLIVPVTDRTFSLNMNELIKLTQVNEIKDWIVGNSTNSYSTNSEYTDGNTTNSNPTNSNPTNGNSTNSSHTSNIPVQLPLASGNSTTNLMGESPNNNKKQQELKEERKEEKQKEVFSSFSVVDIQNEINDYLKSPSKYFFGDNVNLLIGTYEKYRVQYQDTKLNSITRFDQVLYFFLLRATNSSDVQDLNLNLKQPISINLSEVHTAFKLIISNKVVNSEYKDEVLKVINTKSEIGSSDDVSNENSKAI